MLDVERHQIFWDEQHLIFHKQRERKLQSMIATNSSPNKNGKHNIEIFSLLLSIDWVLTVSFTILNTFDVRIAHWKIFLNSGTVSSVLISVHAKKPKIFLRMTFWFNPIRSLVLFERSLQRLISIDYRYLLWTELNQAYDIED